MAKYNQKRVTETVTNYQGGTSVKLSPELELVGLLATGLDGRFYETEGDREKRLGDVIKTVGKKDPELVAKALVYARSVMGQRSVTHVGSIKALSVLGGNPIASKFFGKRNRKVNSGGVIYRLDDMLEIISYYKMRNADKPLPNSIKRGFKRVLESADAYELAKYQAKNSAISLVDVVNLVHPKPSERMQETFRKLMNGELKQFNTAEDKNTKAGQVVADKVKKGEITKEEAKKELKEAKASNWKTLINDGTIGYLALLRNLRNITDVAEDGVFDKAMELLVDGKSIKKSLVFPHQIDIAFTTLMLETNLNQSRKNKLLTAVNTAYELSVPNLTELFQHGRTAVVVDTSYSMTSSMSFNGKRINTLAIEKAALIAATFTKGIGADLYHFSNRCSTLTYNPLDTVNTIKSGIVKEAYHGGTEFSSIFSALNGKYDRVFVISDMQGSDQLLRGSSYQNYINKYGQPYIYSVDLCGHGNSMFKQTNKLINLFGYSSDIYEMVKTAEINPKAILKKIREIVI